MIQQHNECKNFEDLKSLALLPIIIECYVKSLNLNLK